MKSIVFTNIPARQYIHTPAVFFPRNSLPQVLHGKDLTMSITAFVWVVEVLLATSPVASCSDKNKMSDARIKKETANEDESKQ